MTANNASLHTLRPYYKLRLLQLIANVWSHSYYNYTAQSVFRFSRVVVAEDVAGDSRVKWYTNVWIRGGTIWLLSMLVDHVPAPRGLQGTLTVLSVHSHKPQRNSFVAVLSLCDVDVASDSPVKVEAYRAIQHLVGSRSGADVAVDVPGGSPVNRSFTRLQPDPTCFVRAMATE